MLMASGIAGTLVFSLLLLLSPATKKLFSKTWHYYSLFVPIFFLLGGTLIAGAMANHVQPPRPGQSHAAPRISTEATPTQNHFTIPLDPGLSSLEVRGYTASNRLDPGPIIPSSITAPLMKHMGRISPIVIACWALGAVLFMGINIKKYLQYRNLVLGEAVPCHGIPSKIPVAISPVAHTPMLIGLVKPVIVLPKMHFENEALDIILTHELTHHQRKDILLKMVALIANAIHWYNPAVYILNWQLNMYCELSCDEAMASKMDAAGRRFYGETILQVLQHSTRGFNPSFATSLCNSKKSIKGRLKSMMNTKKMKKSVAALGLAAIMLVVGGGFAISHLVNTAVPVYAADVAATQTDEPDQVETTRPIYYQGQQVGLETTEYAESHLIEPTPIIFENWEELFEAVYEEMGNIMLPTYLPEGFVLTDVGIFNPRNDSPWPEMFTDGCYRHLNKLTLTFGSGEDRIWLDVLPFQPYTRECATRSLRRLTADDLPTLMDNESPITINGMNGSLGSQTEWHFMSLFLQDIDNDLSHLFSENANSAARYSGTIYRFYASIDSIVSEDDLIKMAESLTHILDMQ